jgi:cytochrome P450
MTTLFTPPTHPRPRDFAPVWTAFVGIRARNSVAGWPETAFTMAHRTRRILNLTVHIITDPVAIGRVMLDNKANYERPDLIRRLLRPMLGNGMFNAEGEDWRTQRRIAAPTFAPGAVARLSDGIAAAVHARLATWPTAARRIDMAAEATDTTMAIIAGALFSGDARLTTPKASAMINDMLVAAGQARIGTLLGLPDLGLSPVMRRARRGQDFLLGVLAAMVDERGPGGGADDFFGGLIRALNEHYAPAEARQLAIDNAVAFYVAGHETTANALTWTTYLLAAQPELQEQVRAESQAALAGGTMATLADRVPLLRQCLDEALRLYPPAPRFDRQALAPDQLGDLAIAQGDLVSIWPWVVHRHAHHWDNPDSFDHTRFAPDAKARLHRYQYIPFGAGPRVCVGARFAVVEALITLALWLTQRRFAITPGQKPMPLGQVTLRPDGGMPLMVTPL